MYEPKDLPLTEVPHERPMACGILMGKANQAGWNQAERTTDFYDVKGIVDALLAELGVTSYEVNRGTEPYFHPGVSAQYLSLIHIYPWRLKMLLHNKHMMIL